MSQINLQHGTIAKQGEQEDYRVKTDMLRSIGKQSWESGESVQGNKRYAMVGKICRKVKVLSLE